MGQVRPGALDCSVQLSGHKEGKTTLAGALNAAPGIGVWIEAMKALCLGKWTPAPMTGFLKGSAHVQGSQGRAGIT